MMGLNNHPLALRATSGTVELPHDYVEWLRSHGFQVRLPDTGIPQDNPDEVIRLVVLYLARASDIPELVGARQRFGGPLLVLTPVSDESVHVLSLELGADDYLTLPVNPAVLVARVRALLRRLDCAAVPEGDTLVLGGLTIHGGRREVFLEGESIPFTTLEFDLLWYLARNAGQVLSRNEIHRTIYNRDYNGFDRSIDMYISRLRHKLGDDQLLPRFLKTVRGTGYLMSHPGQP